MFRYYFMQETSGIMRIIENQKQHNEINDRQDLSLSFAIIFSIILLLFITIVLLVFIILLSFYYYF